jgi:hypothetical protein
VGAPLCFIFLRREITPTFSDDEITIATARALGFAPTSKRFATYLARGLTRRLGLGLGPRLGGVAFDHSRLADDDALTFCYLSHAFARDPELGGDGLEREALIDAGRDGRVSVGICRPTGAGFSWPRRALGLDALESGAEPVVLTVGMSDDGDELGYDADG